MKNLFKHASSSWVRYNKYEWKKDKNNKYYIVPAPNAMPQIYDPLQDYKPMVLDAEGNLTEEVVKAAPAPKRRFR